MKKILALFLALAMVACLFVGCGNETTDPTDPPATADPGNDTPDTPAEAKRVALVIPSLAAAYHINLVKGVRSQVKDGYELTVFEYNSDISQLANVLDDCINNAYDMILFSAQESYAAEEQLLAAKNAGIPVINFDMPTDYTDLIVCQILSADYELGYVCGEAMVAAAEGKELKVVEAEGTANAVATFMYNRAKGYEDAVAGNDNIVTVATPVAQGFEATDWLVAGEATIQNHPEANAAVGFCESHTIGLVQAFENAGMTDVVVISVDSSETLIRYMEDGMIYACVDQQSFEIGQKVMQEAYNYFENGACSVALIEFPMKTYTMENVDEYYSRLEEINKWPAA